MPEKMPETHTLAQRRAKAALSAIQELIHQGGYGNYTSYVKALPAQILISGLGQAIATIRSRKDKLAGYEQLYQHLENWLCGADNDAPYQNYEAKDLRLLHAIVNEDQNYYIRAQAEALAYLEWLRKFAEAELKDEDDTKENDATNNNVEAR